MINFFYPLTWIANQRARRIRAAFAKLLASNPRAAIEHVNTALERASREEEQRQLSLNPAL